MRAHPTLALLLVGLTALACQSGGNGGDDDDDDRDGGPDDDAGSSECDRDGDGYENVGCGGDDCDDGNPAINPGVPDHGPTSEIVLPREAMGEDADVYARAAVDTDGSLHVGYRVCVIVRCDVGWATKADGVWRTEVVAENLSMRGPDVGVGPAGDVHLVYLENQNNEGALVRHAFRDAGGWTIETIDESQSNVFWNNGGSSPSIFVAPDGSLHVATNLFEDSDPSELRYLTDAGGSWSMEIVRNLGSFASRPTSIARDEAGAIHVVYTTGNSIGYSTNVGGPWASEAVDDEADVPYWGMPALRISPAGDLHATWVKGDPYGDTPYLHLFHGIREGAGWTHERVDEDHEAPFASAPATPADGSIHFVYTTRDSETWHARSAGGSWSFERVVTTAGYPTLAVGRDGLVHVFHESDEGLVHTSFVVPDGVDDDCDGTAR